MKALIIVLTLVFPAAAHAQWFVIPPSATTASSTAVMSITPFDSAFETIGLTVEYAPNLGCLPYVGIIFVRRGGKGRPLTTSLEPGGSLVFEFGHQKWVVDTHLIRYENGFEAIGRVSPALVDRIRSGDAVRATYDKWYVDFAPTRDVQAIASAERGCRAR